MTSTDWAALLGAFLALLGPFLGAFLGSLLYNLFLDRRD